MYKKKTMGRLLGAALTFSLLVTGCSEDGGTNSGTDSTAEQPTNAAEFPERPREFTSAQTYEPQNYDALSCTTDTSALFTDRDLSGSYDSITAEIRLDGDTAAIEGTGASAEGSVIRITDEGTYRITGTLRDGQILVDSEGKVQLLLAGADITCSNSAAIYIMNAKKAFLTTEEGTENFLTDGSTYTYAAEGDNEPDAAVFSKDSLTMNGSGTLHVTGNYNEGITGKDDLVITSGTITVEAVGNGIKGKDYVAVAGGDITVNAGGDGMKSNNETDAGCGFVYIRDGRLQITAQEDGIQADTEFIADGGEILITSGGGAANAPAQTQDFGGMGGGRGGMGGWGDFFNEEGTTAETEDTTSSTKAIKAGTLLWINGGSFVLDSADDGLHSNADLSTAGGTVEVAAGGDGIHADGRADLSGGSITISRSNEGIEAAVIRCMGASIDLTASDDGFNASDGTSQGAMGTYSEDCLLEISDGTVYVNAGGDGLDSNGVMNITGGTVLVDGPENSGNGALDTNGAIYATGGLVIAAGSSGMAEYPTGSNTLVITTDTMQTAGTLVTICGDDGSELSYAPAKTFNSVVIRSDLLQAGVSYSVYLGGTSNAASAYGLYEAGSYNQDGTEAGSFTMTENTAFVGEAGGMMGGWQQDGGRFHGGGGGRFQDGEMPEIPQDGSMPEMPQDGEMMTPPGGFQGGKMPEMPPNRFMPGDTDSTV